MNEEQLTLFDDDEVTGSGQPHAWPTADPEPEAVQPTQADELPLNVEDAA